MNKKAYLTAKGFQMSISHEVLESLAQLVDQDEFGEAAGVKAEKVLQIRDHFALPC